jgi:hypothetical protein
MILDCDSAVLWKYLGWIRGERSWIALYTWWGEVKKASERKNKIKSKEDI